MSEAPLTQLRAICLALPEAVEVTAWGDPTFRVRNKIFAMHKSGDGRPSVWLKARPGVQEMLTNAEPQRYYVPPYVGHNGWVGARLDVEVDWDYLASLIKESFRMTAPKRLSKSLGQG